jgi:tripartite-type tricarboxylate transporter receptor subunit TctC
MAMTLVKRFRYLLGAALTLAVIGMFAWPTKAIAEEFSGGLIRIFVPTTPSTPPDIISRVIANELTKSEGWKVIVENHPGAVMTIAGSQVLKRPADGTSIYAMSVPVTAAPAFLPDMPFQVNKDFVPVIKVSTSYNVLVVHPSVKANSVAELVDLIKRNPDKLTFSSGGFGTPAHLIGELFKLKTGVRATHVPYQQFPQAIGDLMGGTNQFMFVTSLPVVNLINAGKLRALAVTAPKRMAILPNVPTIVEQGYPDLVVEDWVGFSVKAGTPDDIITRLNMAINRALAQPSVREAFNKLGAEPAGGTPEAYGELVNEQLTRWAKVVNDSGMKMHQ